MSDENILYHDAEWGPEYSLPPINLQETLKKLQDVCYDNYCKKLADPEYWEEIFGI